MSGFDAVAYKVLGAAQMADWQDSGHFAGSPADLADGFVHLSTAAQLDATLEKHFAGQSELHIAAIDLSRLGDALRWEPSRGGALFPHVYAALPFAAVLAHGPLRRGADGAAIAPSIEDRIV